MTDVQRLLDIESIKQLKSRYCRFIDTKQWERLRDLFTADARFEGLGSAPTGAGVEEFVGGISTRLARAVAVHHCHTPDIAFVDADTARGVWAMQDFVQWLEPIELREAPGAQGFVGFGHYEEEYRRIDGQWKIRLLRLTRLRIDPLPPGAPAPRPGFLAASSDWLGLQASAGPGGG